jgi:hypothetical protein
MSIFTKTGVRCDWCGKISNRPDGEYVRPSRFGYLLVGYIRQPEWERNHTENDKHEPIDSEHDICEECAADLCPECGSDQIVKLTPVIPGPDGWGGRCKTCGKRWDVPKWSQDEEQTEDGKLLQEPDE